MKPLLILGGTRDAVALAEDLAERLGEAVSITTSLAGRTRDPVQPPGSVRVGGFGGVAGLKSYLADHGIAAVVDATHPFAAQISKHAVAACTDAGIPLLRLERPPWQAQPGDDWRLVESHEAAAEILPGIGKSIFLTVGSMELEPYLGLRALRFLVRAIEPGAVPDLPDGWTTVFARGPFNEAEELALMRRHGIDVLVTKNSGGKAVAAKLLAARTLGVPVVMIARPAALNVPAVASVNDAVDWLERLLDAS